MQSKIPLILIKKSERSFVSHIREMLLWCSWYVYAQACKINIYESSIFVDRRGHSSRQIIICDERRVYSIMPTT